MKDDPELKQATKELLDASDKWKKQQKKSAKRREKLFGKSLV